MHQPGANHAPGAAVTQVNHSVHTLSTFLRIRADPSIQAPVVQTLDSVIHQAPVVQMLHRAIYRIKIYPVDNAIGFPNTYPLDSDLTGPSCSKGG